MSEQKQTMEVYHIVEREGQKSRWTRIGIGFVNKDSSLNLFLETLPLDGRIHVRTRSERHETKE